MENKFNKLREKIENFSHKSESEEPRWQFSKNYNNALDFFASVISGSIAGYIIDSFFEKKFLYTVIFFFLGIVTGIYGIIKKMRKSD